MKIGPGRTATYYFSSFFFHFFNIILIFNTKNSRPHSRRMSIPQADLVHKVLTGAEGSKLGPLNKNVTVKYVKKVTDRENKQNN